MTTPGADPAPTTRPRWTKRARLAWAAAHLVLRPWVVNAEGRRLYIDRRDRRAWRLQLRHGAFDADTVRVWQLLTTLIDADLVLDIGANYGEVILAGHYGPEADIHLVEANPRLVPLLQRSVSEAGLDVTLHALAASDSAGSATLRITNRTSGQSSLEPRDGADRTVRVETARIDDLVAPGHERCLFKIDVEGHEPAVLGGMTKTLEGCERWLGLVEHFRRPAPLDPTLIPYIRAVRLPDLTFVPVTPEVTAGIDAMNGTYAKDLVVSNLPF